MKPMDIEFIGALPLIILGAFAILLLISDGIWKSKKLNFYGTLFALILAFAGTIVSIMNYSLVVGLDPNALVSKGTLSFVGYSYYFDLIFIFAGILTLLAGKDFIRREYKELNEFYTLIILAIFGMSLIAHSNNLIILFLGIETMSLSFYVLAGFFRTSNESVEAAIKYFLLGAFATGFLVYGMAMVYGASKSLMINEISDYIKSGNLHQLYFTIGIALLFIGLSFKVAAFPFHQWAPDVYYGAPTVVGGFMSTAGKSAAILALLILGKNFIFTNAEFNLGGSYSRNIQDILAYVSAATMLVGNFTALVQKNIKRMLAYSSVAHAGYLLIGIVANNPEGWNGIAFYSLSYLFMQFGAFAIVSINEREEGKYNLYEDYKGYSKSHPFIAGILSIFMLSLAGIPPFAGFFGKYYLFVSAIKANYLWLTIIAVISSIVSMYYYIGLILVMYFKEPSVELKTNVGLPLVAVVICLLGTLFFGIFPQLVLDFTYRFLG